MEDVMRKVVYGGATSLDQFLAREGGAVDWLIMDHDAMEMMAGMRNRFDVMVMGRKTWSVAMEQFSEEDLKRAEEMSAGTRSVVFSRTLEAGRKGSYEIVNDNPVEFVRGLRSQAGKDICVMGGGEIGSLLLDAGLIDEIGFNIHPLLLGSGAPAFCKMSRQIDLELIECKAMKSGCVYVLYNVK
jgi:dihydrofolate reductase